MSEPKKSEFESHILKMLFLIQFFFCNQKYLFKGVNICQGTDFNLLEKAYNFQCTYSFWNEENFTVSWDSRNIFPILPRI